MFQTMPTWTLGAPPNSRAYGVCTTIAHEEVSAPQLVNKVPRRWRSPGHRPRIRSVKYRLMSNAGTVSATRPIGSAAVMADAMFDQTTTELELSLAYDRL